MKPAIIIPVYNHGSRVGDVVRRALTHSLPVIVVDDGSTDDTPAVLAAVDGIRLLRHPANQGKGAALRTGFTDALACGCDVAVTIDADGQHRPEDALLLLQAAEEKQRMLVIGSRQGMHGVHVPWTSRFGRGFSNFWVRVSGGPRVTDSQSGFRLYPLPETLSLPVLSRRYQYEVEVLVWAQRAGIAISEVEIEAIYQAERISHFRPWLDFWRNSATFCRLICGRLFCRSRP